MAVDARPRRWRGSRRSVPLVVGLTLLALATSAGSWRAMGTDLAAPARTEAIGVRALGVESVPASSGAHIRSAPPAGTECAAGTSASGHTAGKDAIIRVTGLPQAERPTPRPGPQSDTAAGDSFRSATGQRAPPGHAA